MLLMPKKRDVFCSELLFCCSAAPSFVSEAATFPWIWTVWLKLPLPLWQRSLSVRERAGVTGMNWVLLFSREDMCRRVKHHAKFGSIFPGAERNLARAVSAFSHRAVADKSWQGEKFSAVIQLLHSLTLLTSCMIQRVHMSNFAANNLRTNKSVCISHRDHCFCGHFWYLRRGLPIAMCKKTASFRSFLMQQKSGLWSSGSIKPPPVVNPPVPLLFSHPWLILILSSLTPFFFFFRLSSSAPHIWPRCFPGVLMHPHLASQADPHLAPPVHSREQCFSCIQASHQELLCGKISLSKPGQKTATDQARGCQ